MAEKKVIIVATQLASPERIAITGDPLSSRIVIPPSG